MTVDLGLREPPQVSGGEESMGISTSCAVDPIALMRRVRDECGDVGRVPPGRARGGAPHRSRGQRAVLPRPRGGARPGRGLPVHDADLRRRAWCSTHPPNAAARCSTTRRCATSSCGATPPPSPTRSRPWWPAGHGRRHDRPPRLVRRAHHLHLLGLPHREASSATSSTVASPSSTTTSNRAPTPSPMSTPTPRSRASAAATRPGSGSWLWCRGSWTAAAPVPPATDDDRDLLDV